MLMESRVFLDSFTLAWEQRKLDTITDVRDGTHDSPQYVELGHPFITSKNVKDGFINYEDIQYVSDKDYEEINKRSKVDKNDILMGMIGTIGNIALVRETPDFAIKNVALIKDIGDVYYRYLYHCLQSNSIAHQLDENLDGGTQKFIALNKIRELVIPVPSDHEQQKIGDYMESLDNLITLHQCKESAFSEWKDSGFLQKHKTTWEQRKVQDVADRFDNLRIPVAANLRVHGTTPYYGANGIQDYVEGFTHDGEFVLVAEDGANDLKNYPVKCVTGRIWVNNHAHVLQGKAGIADNSFLAFAISQSDIESLLVGGGRAKLNAETLMSIEFRLPCLQEQYRIGEYLTQLDHLITLHQRKPFCINRRQKWKQTTKMQNYSANIMQNGFQYIRKGR